RRKIDWHILPLMCILYLIQFMDKTTLGSSAILGLKTDTHLNATEYNWLGTIFYISYLIFEYPQNLAFQRFPVGKWMSINVLVWAIAMCFHAACKNFAGLFIVRFILGMCEGSITAGFMITSSMFYTRKEQITRFGYWFLMNGTAEVITGFLAFGSLHIHTPSFEPWRWLMIICGIITLITGICYWFFYPDSPTNAWFLTREERVIAVNRIKENQAGVENKHFKKEQVIECLMEMKTWIFFLYCAIHDVPNSLINQNSILINSYGFTTFQTTLLSSASGIVKIVGILTGTHMAAYFKDSIAYVGAAYYVPVVICSILVNVLPLSDKGGLLTSIYLTQISTTPFALSLAWVTQTTAGHTKRITMNAIMLIANCVGNAVGPQMWLAKYAPRFHVPWTVIAICYTVAAVLLLVQRYMLKKENKKRDREPPDTTYDDVWVKVTDENGEVVEKRVDRAFLDLTDRQNRDFRYAL
ncbi:membrane transporter, partial [Fomitiporia mediterranea MF3/22]|uniref:membrane transporter n=1 Tax=Fomitiporia mediterranea (strain MF3/22) TaxID=694068 RepID=UPI000440994D